MNKFFEKYLPDEVVSAYEARRLMYDQINDVGSKGAKFFVSSIPFLLGFLLGLLLSKHFSKDIAQAALTISGVLAGFVVTMMLFTGTVDGANDLNLEEAQNYKKKVIYLLWSQVTSLGFYLLTVLMSIVWIFFNEVDALKDGIVIISGLVVGFLSVSVVRTFILPYQIFELHNFTLTSLVLRKQDECNKKIEEFKQGFDDE
jgi:hypothetical protein